MTGEPRCTRCGGPLPRHYPPCAVAEPLSGAARMAMVTGVALLVALIVAVFTTDCAPVKAGPFYPPVRTPCGSDADCPDGTHCGFPAVDTHAICLDGDSNIDTPPDWGRRRPDAGKP